MSRAFVREIDDAPPEPPPERAISSAPNLVTARGAHLIEAAVRTIEDQIENQPEPAAAALLRRDLRYWLARRATMQVRQTPDNADSVTFGTNVTIEQDGRQRTFRIVGEDEADPAIGCLSWVSPLARALEGARQGDVVDGPAGEIAIVAISAAAETPG